MALLRISGQALLGQYFDKYYLLASGVSETCIGLGIIIFSPLTQVLLDTYGWRNTLLLLGGIYSHMIIGGILLRSPSGWQKFSSLTTNGFDDENDPCLEPNASKHDIFTWVDLPSTRKGRAAKCNFNCMHLTSDTSSKICRFLLTAQLQEVQVVLLQDGSFISYLIV